MHTPEPLAHGHEVGSGAAGGPAPVEPESSAAHAAPVEPVAVPAPVEPEAAVPDESAESVGAPRGRRVR